MSYDENELNGNNQNNEQNQPQQNTYSNDSYQQNTYQQIPPQQNPYQQNPPQQNSYQQPPYQQNQPIQNPYQQNPYQQPQYQQNYNPYYQQEFVPTKHPKNGFCIASMVLGIISICMFCIFYLSIPMAILSLIFGIIANKAQKDGKAKAGIILSTVSLSLCVIYWIFIIFIFANDPSLFNDSFYY